MVMVTGEDSLQYEIAIRVKQLEQGSVIIYLGYMLNEKETDNAEDSREVGRWLAY